MQKTNVFKNPVYFLSNHTECNVITTELFKTRTDSQLINKILIYLKYECHRCSYHFDPGFEKVTTVRT